jgi:hypothetical protein
MWWDIASAASQKFLINCKGLLCSLIADTAINQRCAASPELLVCKALRNGETHVLQKCSQLNKGVLVAKLMCEKEPAPAHR